MDPIDAVMESIIKVIESDKIREWLDGSEEIRNIEGYVVRAVMVEQSRIALNYIRKDKTEGRLAPEFYDSCLKTDRETLMIINQIKEILNDDEAKVVWCLENNIKINDALKRTGMSKHRYYLTREQIVDKIKLT